MNLVPILHTLPLMSQKSYEVLFSFYRWGYWDLIRWTYQGSYLVVELK